MNSLTPMPIDANVKDGLPTEFECARARRLLAVFDDATASGDPEYIAEAYEAAALYVEVIRPRVAAIVAAGLGPVDANGAQLYTVCPRCGRLLRQYVTAPDGAHMSTGVPEYCVRCVERGIFS